MSLNKARLAAIGVSVGALVLGGAAAAAFGASTPSPSSTQSAPGSDGRGPDGGHGPGGSQDTPVTGDEATTVKDAVKAKDSAVTITEVRKDPDGSYDAIGTKNGSPVFYDVSKDLKTVTERTGGPGGKGGPGGPGAMGKHTEVTGSEATKVGDAVKAKDSAVTVTKVLKDEDGSYDVLGTKAGAPIAFEVSKDLTTVTQRTGGPGGPGGMRGGMRNHTEVTGDEATKVGDAVKAKDSAVTVVKVFKDDDGSYAVFGTKGDSRVFVKVSKDLKTVTVQTGGPGRGPGGHGPRGGQDGDQGGAPGQAPSAPSTSPSTSASTTSLSA